MHDGQVKKYCHFADFAQVLMYKYNLHGCVLMIMVCMVPF